MTIKQETLEKIKAQIANEILFARNYKQNKISNWQKNEDLAYAKKVYNESSRSNIDLGRGEEFISTLLSKIDNSISFKFTKRKESQLMRVNRLNSLKVIDQLNNDWDIKDLAGKEQMIIYGRAIFSYHAESIDGYKACLENIDVYDYLIDPSAGGIDMEKAMYMGNYGVVKMKSDLKAGVKRGDYLKAETERLIEGTGNSTDLNQEESNKRNREVAQGTTSTNRNIGNPDKYILWRWFTTYEGVRYYTLYEESSGTIIEIDKLEDRFESNMFPYWSFARRPSLTEFWSPSPLDTVREIFYTQAVSINQAVDNSEQINKPQKAIDTSALENLAEVKYRKDGVIRVKSGIDVNKAIQILQTPSINAPFEVFNILENIQAKASGLTGATKGIAEEEKVGIYEGNQANAADRFGLYNKTYSFGYKRFAKLYEWGVKEHLTKKVAVDMIGPNGITQEEVSRRDIFRKNEEFGCMVESSQAETALSEVDKKNQLTFLSQNIANPVQNPKKAYEISASIAGFSEEMIRELLDTSDFGDAQLMAEADKDIEDLLDGKFVKPNTGGTTAYKQRFVDFMMNNSDDMDNEQRNRFVTYLDGLEPIIMANMVKIMNDKMMKEQMMQVPQTPAEPPPTGNPLEEINQQPTNDTIQNI